VAGEQRRDEREQATQVRRQVDVHVADHPRGAGAPRGAQRAPATLAVDEERVDADQLARQPRRDRGRGVGRGVVGDDDAPGERELGGQIAMQPTDAALEPDLLVVDRDDDVDLRGRPEGGAVRSGRRDGHGHPSSFGSLRASSVG
jgi:hypothetical protein